MNSINTTEFIVRAVCVCEGHLLLCRHITARNVYLPGGHIESGEGAIAAIRREVREEMGLEAIPGRFLGAAENRFLQKGVEVTELNLVFAVDMAGVSVDTPPRGLEGHIEFFWHPLADVETSGLRPATLACRLQGWLDGTDSDRFIPMPV